MSGILRRIACTTRPIEFTGGFDEKVHSCVVVPDHHPTHTLTRARLRGDKVGSPSTSDVETKESAGKHCLHRLDRRAGITAEQERTGRHAVERFRSS